MASKRTVFLFLNLCLFAFNTLLFLTQRSKNGCEDGSMRLSLEEKDIYTIQPDCRLCHDKLGTREPLYSSNFSSNDRKANPTFPLYHNASKHGYQKSSYTQYLPRLRRVIGVDCKSLIGGNTEEVQKALQIMSKNPKIPKTEKQYLKWTKDCVRFKSDRGYIQVPVTQEEEDFPLAFSIAMFKDVEQVERLLRSVYQPQNIYCIHIDLKSPLILHQTMQSITSCFDNVFIASNLEMVNWGDSSVLSPVINCMHDLVKYFKGKWKYFINLTGQEFPLRSNYELVRISKIFNGSNDITGSLRRAEPQRTGYQWKYRWSKTYKQILFYNSFLPKSPPPYKMKIFKGEVHGLFSQRMVEYIIKNEQAQSFLKWCENSGHASEHFWNTLNYNRHLKAPGGYIGPIEMAEDYSFHDISRAKHWNEFLNRKCSGQYVRGICIFGVGDLHWLTTRRQLFANKFYLIDQYYTLDCLEEWQRNRTLLGENVAFDEKVYRNLPTVIHGRKNGFYEDNS